MVVAEPAAGPQQLANLPIVVGVWGLGWCGGVGLVWLMGQVWTLWGELTAVAC